MEDKLGPNGETRINPNKEDFLLAVTPDVGVGKLLGAIAKRMPKTQQMIKQVTSKVKAEVPSRAEVIKQTQEKLRAMSPADQKLYREKLLKMKEHGVPAPSVPQPVKFKDLGKSAKGTATKDGITKPTSPLEYSQTGNSPQIIKGK
jgi:hypothetical protein